MERWLDDWILNYVDGDPENSSETTKAEKPLAAAEVRVQEVRAIRCYTSQFSCGPTINQGLTVSPPVQAALGQSRLMYARLLLTSLDTRARWRIR